MENKRKLNALHIHNNVSTHNSFFVFLVIYGGREFFGSGKWVPIPFKGANVEFRWPCTIGWINPLFCRLYIHLCGFLDCLYIRQIWLIFLMSWIRDNLISFDGEEVRLLIFLHLGFDLYHGY